MDKRVDYFLPGPDINADGHQELYVATLAGIHGNVYADALSGKSGETLWWSRRKGTNYQLLLKRIAWWNTGRDGWPQLLVQTIPEAWDSTIVSPSIDLFSAGSGEHAGRLLDTHDFSLADADQDGTQDLLAFRTDYNSFARAGGMLQTHRGVANERWRHVGGVWQPAADYDGDGYIDFLSIYWNTINALSGKTGQRLWQANVPGYVHDTLKPLQTDLDGDAVPDIMAYQGPCYGNAGGGGQRHPLTPISGKTGRAITWGEELPYYSTHGVFFLEERDLDGDQAKELIFSLYFDWDYPFTRMSAASVQHWLFVHDAKSGQLKWRVPLSEAYGKPGGSTASITFENNRVDVHPQFRDLNHDKFEDIILPAEVSGKTAEYELRACNGRDGSTLWSRPLLNERTANDFWQDVARYEVADLDGDQNLELIGLEYGYTPLVNGTRELQARPFLLDVATGKQRWQSTLAVWHTCGQVQAANYLMPLKPRPVALKRQGDTSLVAMGLWGWGNASKPGRIVLLDHTGKLCMEQAVLNEHAFQIYVHDLDGDGNDDVWLNDQGVLKAWRIEERENKLSLVALWEITPNAGINVLDFLPAANGRLATIAVQSGHEVHGYDAKTGQLTWKTVGPQVVNGNGTPIPLGVHFVAAENAAAYPNVLFKWEGNCALRTTRVLADATTGSVSSQPVKLIAKPDPRLVRRARWEMDSGFIDLPRGLTQVAWSCILCLGLLWIPTRTLWSMIRKGQWSLRTFLLLPLLVAIIIVLLRIPVPEILERGRFNTRAFQRLEVAFTALPIIFFIGALWDHLRQGHWRSLMVWLGVTLALGALWLYGVVNVFGQFHLAPEERYVVTSWHIPLAVGFYCAGMAAAVWTIWETLFRWLKWWPKEENEAERVDESAIKCE